MFSHKIVKHNMEYIFQGLLFVGAMYLLIKVILPTMIEQFDTVHPDSKVDQPCPPNSVKCASGDCKLKNDIYGMC